MAGNAEAGKGPGGSVLQSTLVRGTAVLAVLVIVATFLATHFGGSGDADSSADVKPARTAAAEPGVAATPAAARPARRAVAAAANAPVGDAAGNAAPVVNSVAHATPASNASHLDDHLTYQYNALGRRDPFQSLVDGQFIGADQGGGAPPDPGGIKVVGIVWGPTDQFAMVEDVRGNSYVLRKGDKVQNGVVTGLRRDGLVVSITADGQTQSITIPLARKGEQNAR